jgi:hypothetical protein
LSRIARCQKRCRIPTTCLLIGGSIGAVAKQNMDFAGEPRDLRRAH